MQQPSIKETRLKLPKNLDDYVEYKGNARWIQIYWGSDPINSLVFDDGSSCQFGRAEVWEILLSGIAASSFMFEFDEELDCLLLDRDFSRLYQTNKELANKLFGESQSLEFLAVVNGDVKKHTTVSQPPVFKKLFNLGVAVSLIAFIGFFFINTFLPDSKYPIFPEHSGVSDNLLPEKLSAQKGS